MKIEKNILINGIHGKVIALDIFYKETNKSKPVLIYIHGFNGFKDWANFDLIAQQFAQAGFVFIKFNFSHNGTSPQHPEEFVDLEAYAENNYTKELFDLQQVIDWTLEEQNEHTSEINKHAVGLIGHSKGGGVVILKAAEEKKVGAVATWASVSECKTPWSTWDKERMNEWKEKGVQYILNSRTKQQMPLHYQLYEDYQQHKERLDILEAISILEIPVLICHGTKDEVVPVAKAYQLNEAKPGSELFLVESNHVFGRKHPWIEEHLPDAMQQVVNRTISFFRSSLI
jgi:dienelactone hydrolase